ncbi:hypothetical protein ACOSQ3_004827 [Xanthoceras sorbifolium]
MAVREGLLFVKSLISKFNELNQMLQIAGINGRDGSLGFFSPSVEAHFLASLSFSSREEVVWLDEKPPCFL